MDKWGGELGLELAVVYSRRQADPNINKAHR